MLSSSSRQKNLKVVFADQSRNVYAGGGEADREATEEASNYDYDKLYSGSYWSHRA